MLKKIFRSFGYDLVKAKNKVDNNGGVPIDIIDNDFLELFRKCRPFSFTGIIPMFALYSSVRYILEKNIDGDLVECGVWRGGSAMLMAHTLMKCGNTERKIFLYDTFEGMSEPIVHDENMHGKKAKELLSQQDKTAGKNVWCYSTLDEVKKNILSTGYPEKNVVFVKGKVEDTIPTAVPEKISLLRLDTDFFESTYHELLHLFPLLREKGILIIDDYGYWKGARKAVDNYFSEKKIPVLLNRIDYTVRLAIKN